jgi:hypothetical protein
MHSDDRAVILLYLLFPQGKVCDERNVKVFFYHLYIFVGATASSHVHNNLGNLRTREHLTPYK